MSDPEFVDPFPAPPGAPTPDEVIGALESVGTARSVDEAIETVIGVAVSGDAEPERSAPWRWQIGTVGEAEWAMRKAAEAKAAIAAAEEQYDEWVRPFTDWLDGQVRRPRATLRFFQAHLERWALDERDRTGGAQYPLPSGIVRTTRTPAKATIPEKGKEKADATRALLAWAVEHDLLDVINPDVYLTKLNEVASPMVIVRVTFEGCDHIETLRLDHDLWTPAMYPVGTEAYCSACVAARVVEAVAVEERVLDGHGRPVPGAVVDPAHVTAKVTPK